MSDDPVTRTDAAQAIGRAIKKQAENLAHSQDAATASAALKDLAEALAWLTHTNQPH